MLEPILQSVGAGNPQLAQLIGQHPGEFLQLLSEVAGDEDAPLPPGAQAIQVTEEERDAIERVSLLTLKIFVFGLLLTINLVMPVGFRQRTGYPGLFRMWQEW
jgi:hypothetical protein